MREVTLLDTTKQYTVGSTPISALRAVTLSVEEGAFVVLIGRAASGKTTLLNLLGLLARPTSGQVFVDGEPMNALSDRQRAYLRSRQVGFIFQRPCFLPSLTLLENVMLPLRYSKPVKPDESYARALLDEVGLGSRAGDRPDQVSRGEWSRVQLARCLVNHPSLVLLDEPTTGLDSDSAQELIAVVSRHHDEHGVTVVAATHDPIAAWQAERIVRLEGGRIASDEASVKRPNLSN